MGRGKRMLEELDADIREHIERETQDNIERGMSPEEARYAAMRKFGNVMRVKEETREVWCSTWLDELWQDLRFGLRMLRKSPAFAAIAVLTLALGIGTNTAIFSVVDAVLLRPLPYNDPSRLVWATEHFGFGPSTVVSADFPAWKERNHVFEQIGASGGTGGANLTGAGEPTRVTVNNVTTGFFSMLGVEPIVGRAFLPSEGKKGQEHVALLNEDLWRSRFGADTRIVSKAIQLDGTTHTVVGVMPASLRYPRADVWTPLALDDEIFSPHSPRWMMLAVIGRLKPRMEMRQAQSDLQLLTQAMNKQYPPQASRFREHVAVEVISLHEVLVHNVRSLLMILLGATGFVLLIACANVSNLLLSRGVARGREIAVRVALGAGRLRLVRQLLTEGLLLVVIGALLGSVTGLWATKILKELIPAGLPADMHLDQRIFAFSAVISAVALLIFGLVPAFIASRTDVNETLKEGGVHLSAISGTHRLRGLMAAGEIALSLILLIGAGLLSRSFLRLMEVPLGFDPNHLLIATVARPLTVDFNSQLHAAFFRDSLQRIRSLPGVTQAALTERYPLGPFRNATRIVHVQGAEDFRPMQPVSVTAISPDYFHLIGVRLLSGRTFSEGDVADTQRVAVLNQRLAHMIFGDRNALGQHIGFGPPPAPWSEIVGIVADMREDAIEREPAPELFVPYTQHPSFVMSLMLRADSNPEALASAVRSAVASVDKNQPVSEIMTMDEVLANSVAPRRFRALLLGLFAALALLLAAIGIYGVIAYSCSLRTCEFGIRIALGADRTDILKLVIRQGFGLTVIGLGAGIAGAIGLTRYLSSLLYEVKPTDPLTFVAVSLILSAVALVACYIPARRVAEVDPMVALSTNRSGPQ
ncbi:MAG: hypothetical protein DMG40_26020 [Acidobacteria bacterium]|nr:MAG: hypothetical protein DMG40_26020 [Acidobacteriota bacterium]